MKLDDTIKEESMEEADPQILKMMLAKLKCLNICKYMLERCTEVKFEKFIYLYFIPF